MMMILSFSVSTFGRFSFPASAQGSSLFSLSFAIFPVVDHFHFLPFDCFACEICILCWCWTAASTRQIHPVPIVWPVCVCAVDMVMVVCTIWKSMHNTGYTYPRLTVHGKRLSGHKFKLCSFSSCLLPSTIPPLRSDPFGVCSGSGHRKRTKIFLLSTALNFSLSLLPPHTHTYTNIFAGMCLCCTAEECVSVMFSSFFMTDSSLCALCACDMLCVAGPLCAYARNFMLTTFNIKCKPKLVNLNYLSIK